MSDKARELAAKMNNKDCNTSLIHSNSNKIKLTSSEDSNDIDTPGDLSPQARKSGEINNSKIPVSTMDRLNSMQLELLNYDTSKNN